MLVQAWFTLFFSFFVSVSSAPAELERRLDLGSLFQLNLVTQINAILTLDSLTTNLITRVSSLLIQWAVII